MKLLERRAIQPRDRLRSSLRRPAVLVAVRVQHLEQPLHRAHRRAVFVLADRVQHFAFARLDFFIGKRRLHGHLADELEHRLEVLRQARAADRHRVTIGAEAERHAARVERVGDLVAALPLGASIEHPRGQVAQPQLGVRFVDASRAERHLYRDGRHRVRLLRDHDRAVLKHAPARRQTPANAGGHEPSPLRGLNQPTVR